MTSMVTVGGCKLRTVRSPTSQCKVARHTRSARSRRTNGSAPMSHSGRSCGHRVQLPANVHCGGQTQQRLCRGVQRILQASCTELRDESFLADTIRCIGLSPSVRGCRLYGRECKHMIRDSDGGDSTIAVGVYQQPVQLAAALIQLSRLRASTYAELGIFAGWTTAVLSAYLTRFSDEPFRGIALDDKFSASESYSLLQALNVNYRCVTSGRYRCVNQTSSVRWAKADGKPRVVRQELSDVAKEFGAPKVGLCFVDADHTYGGVRGDFEALAPYCANMLFHDVRMPSNGAPYT